MTDLETLGITKKEFLQAIEKGVSDAFWSMITNATSYPCADFYEAIRQGAKAAIDGATISVNEKSHE